MFKGKLTAKIKQPDVVNRFYGLIKRESKVEDKIEMQERIPEQTAPHGLKFSFKTRNDAIDVEITKHYLSYYGDSVSIDDVNTREFYCTFFIANYVISVEAHFTEDGELESVLVYVYDSINDYDDGDESDYIVLDKENVEKIFK